MVRVWPWLPVMLLVPAPQMAGAPAIAATALGTLYGAAGRSFIAALVVLSTCGSLNGLILTGGRIYFAMARDGLRDALDPNKTVHDEISGGSDEIELGKTKVASRAYVSWFNFKGAGQQRKVGSLSGGERNRVHLAKLLKSGANVLLLDEPTNDLDVDTLRSLEEALLNFPGCAVIISHDRWFLDRIATHMLAFEGDSKVVWFEGNYQAYEADLHRRLGKQADEPRKFRREFARFLHQSPA
mgnify:CR=1 FL=1